MISILTQVRVPLSEYYQLRFFVFFQFKGENFNGGFGFEIGTASGSFTGSGIDGGGCV